MCLSSHTQASFASAHQQLFVLTRRLAHTVGWGAAGNVRAIGAAVEAMAVRGARRGGRLHREGHRRSRGARGICGVWGSMASGRGEGDIYSLIYERY